MYALFSIVAGFPMAQAADTTIRGRVAFCSLKDWPVSGVTVTAEAVVDRNWQRLAKRDRKTTVTGPDGVYRFTDLLPDAVYGFSVEMPELRSHETVDAVAEPGRETAVRTDLQVCPIPPGPGIWLYGDREHPTVPQPFPLDAEKAVSVQGVRIPTPGEKTPICWVDRREIDAHPERIYTVGSETSLPTEGLLAVQGVTIGLGVLGAVHGDGQCYGVSGSECAWTFSDGWYLQLANLTKTTGSGEQPSLQLQPIDRLTEEGAFRLGSEDDSRGFALSLAMYRPGLYLLQVFESGGKTGLWMLKHREPDCTEKGYLLRLAGPSPYPDERVFGGGTAR